MLYRVAIMIVIIAHATPLIVTYQALPDWQPVHHDHAAFEFMHDHAAFPAPRSEGLPLTSSEAASRLFILIVHKQHGSPWLPARLVQGVGGLKQSKRHALVISRTPAKKRQI